MKKSDKIKIWAFGMRLGNRCGCHQREDRSFSYKGWQFPICSRCTGILTGQLIGLILFLSNVRIPMYINILFLLLMFLDWYIQYKNIKESTNLRRFITGNLAGVAQMTILCYIVEGIIKIVI